MPKARRKNLRLYVPTGYFFLKLGTCITRYDTYNEAYYALIEFQETSPEADATIIRQLAVVHKNGDTRWSPADLTWTQAAGVPSAPPLPLREYSASAGWIYAACEQDAFPLMKIGTTHSLPQRMQALARLTHSPMILRAAVYASAQAYAVERRVHIMLASSRIEGEWFYLHMTQAILEKLVAQAVTFLQEKETSFSTSPSALQTMCP